MGRIGKIHFVCLALALLDALLYLNWRISFRGQWFDILLSILPLVTGSNVMFNRYKQLRLAGKFYFVAMPILNLLLTPIYILGTICFPLTTQAEGRNYEVRDRPGVLASVGVNLIRKTFVFERVVSQNIDYDIEDSPEGRIQLVFKADSVGVTVPRYEMRDTTYYFKN